jgi:hypothetical protein
MDGKEGWVAVDDVPESAVVKETNERKITTHDEVEDVYETEEIQHLGDISNEVINFRQSRISLVGFLLTIIPTTAFGRLLRYRR